MNATTKNPGATPLKAKEHIPGLEHLTHLGKEHVDLEVQIVDSQMCDQTKNCHFWVGVFKHGSASVSEVFEQHTSAEALTLASETGIDSREPILFTDTGSNESQNQSPNPEKEKVNYTLLIPEISSYDRPALDLWMSAIYTAMKSVGPEVIGLNLPKSLIDRPNLEKTIREFLKEATKKMSTDSQVKFKKIFLLNSGHSQKDTLNVMFNLKREFLEKEMNIMILH